MYNSNKLFVNLEYEKDTWQFGFDPTPYEIFKYQDGIICIFKIISG
jgi:hypothetical protein